MTDNLSNRSAQALTLVPANTLSSFASNILASVRRRVQNTSKTSSGNIRFELEDLENRVMLSAAAPTIEALVASPSITTGQGTGATFTLTATNVQNSDDTVANVRFYEDSNDNGVLDVMDTLVALGHKSGSNWSADISHDGFDSSRYFAQASDTTGRNSNLVSAVVEFSPITIDKVSASVSSSKVKLTAVKVDGASSVEFYKDTNGDGIIDAGDTFLGTGKKVGKKWQLVAPVTNDVQPAKVSSFGKSAKHNNSATPVTFMIRGVNADGDSSVTKVIHTKMH